MIKQVVLFAISWRQGGYCVAGKDVKTKEWIRPVTAAGPVPEEQVKGLKLMDVVEMELGSHVSVHHQSENYEMIDKPWKKIKEVDKTLIKPFLDDPVNIWDSKLSKGTDSLTPLEITQSVINTSLCLINPVELNILHEKRKSDGKDKHYGIFIFKKQQYKISITDPIFNSRFRQFGNFVIQKPVLCISLAEEFKDRGRCYKLIAGVI